MPLKKIGPEREPRPSWAMRLQTYIWLVFIGLLILTTGLVDWFGYSWSRKTQTRLAEDRFAIANEQCGDAIGQMLDEPPRRLLDELSYGARNGVVDVKNDKALGLELLERLGQEPNLSSLQYGDVVTGHYVAALRLQNGTILLHVSTPGGKSRETIVSSPTGIPLASPVLFLGYDPRSRPWFQPAVAGSGIQWSRPYLFADGYWGISASQQWSSKDGETAQGVFGADFYLSELQTQLAQLSKQIEGTTTVLTPEGDPLFLPPDSEEQGQADLAALGKLVRERGKVNFSGEVLNIIQGGKKQLVALKRIDTPSGFSAVVVSMAPTSVIYRESDRAVLTMGMLTGAGLIAAILAGWWLANRVSRPLRLLGEELARIGEFKIDPDQNLTSPVTEIGQIMEAVKKMKIGLRSFQRYVPDDLVRNLLANGREAALGGETRRLTLMFSDIEGFTGYSEKVPPDRLVREMSAYFEVLGGKLDQGGGTLDKFIGDGMLVFFNAPEILPNHERRACEAVLDALAELERFQSQPGRPHFHTRIGLHAGEVLVGNIGIKDRFAYTVIGDAANVASRLESLNKIYKTQILVSDQVKNAAGQDFEWRHLDRVTVVGRKGGMDIYELLGRQGETMPEILDLRDHYERAMQCYFQRDFVKAAQLFHNLQGNPAAAIMASRCAILEQTNTASDWTGVFSFEHK